MKFLKLSFMRGLSFDFRDRQDGFSLVEAAIIVTVLGLVIAPFFAHLTQQHQKRELLAQESINESVTAAMAVFVAENGRYPVPADFSLNPTSGSFGAEVSTVALVAAGANSCVSNVCVFNGAVGNNTLPNDRLVYIGALPTQALRLPPTAAANVHGYKYFYAVTEALTRGAGNFAGEITVLVNTDLPGNLLDDATGFDAVGNPVDATDRLLNAVDFILIDPGPDGKGAFSLEGTVSSNLCNNANAGDYYNCEFRSGGPNPTIFIDSSFAQSNTVQVASHFDDALMYNFARKETTFWEIDDALANDGMVNIGTRNDGNIGINKNSSAVMGSPRERLHIIGGSIKVNGVTSSGVSIDSVDLESVESSVEATTGDVNGGQMIGTGGAFYYPGGGVFVPP